MVRHVFEQLVFYDIDKENVQVHIIAVGRKERNRLYIGKKEVEL
jgi:hypothetical protein